MRKRDVKAAFIGGAVALLLTGGFAWAAIPGDGGVIQACSDSGGNLKVVATLPCPKGYTALGPIYTKAGADAAFLTQTAADRAYLGRNATAANADKLDGMDSTDFLSNTNCVGYPHPGIDWHGCELSRANLTGAVLSSSNLVHTNLAHANLSSAILVGANLTGASLEDTTLADTDFTNANLTDASLSGARLNNTIVRDVIYEHTVCPDGANSDDNGGTCVGHF